MVSETSDDEDELGSSEVEAGAGEDEDELAAASAINATAAVSNAAATSDVSAVASTAANSILEPIVDEKFGVINRDLKLLVLPRRVRIVYGIPY